ncbi:MAG: triphosphoribosyl-dephospho-CoA synthase [Pirellula sp.]|nr:triphosphoribosyl-dephospho-CoA synthase [Pirellula sp.]
MKTKSVGQQIQAAILMEASTIKIGNVHPNASFVDMEYEHFVHAADAIGRSIDRCLADPSGIACQPTVGVLVVEATKAMMDHVGRNTSLGTILLIAPLIGCKDRRQLKARLSALTPEDSAHVYEAIRMAKPGGIGTSDAHDVHAGAPSDLMIAMKHAAAYDDVALQYATDFVLVFQGLECYRSLVARSLHQEDLTPVQQLQLRWMSERVDSLIARKGGLKLAEEVRLRSSLVYDAWLARASGWRESWQSLDAWMRQQVSSDGKQLANPGTIADLIATVLFLDSHIQSSLESVL